MRYDGHRLHLRLLLEESVVRPFVASEPVSDVNDNGARIRTSYVAPENRDRRLSDLGSLETSKSLTSNVAPRTSHLELRTCLSTPDSRLSFHLSPITHHDLGVCIHGFTRNAFMRL